MDIRRSLRRLLAEADLDYYTRVFARTGFRGALNRYRNMDRDWEELGSAIVPSSSGASSR